jgi:ligand-binding sensor domain-containing protein
MAGEAPRAARSHRYNLWRQLAWIAVATAGWCETAHAAGAGETVPVKQRTLTPSLRFRNVSVEDGLPNVTISAIVQDKDGFTWIATYDGLAKYDGYEFTVVRDKLPDLTITKIEVDPVTGDLWVGTAKGIARVNPRTREVTNFTLVPRGAAPPEGGTEPSVLAIACAKDGTVWVGTNGYGLLRLDPKTKGLELFRHEEKNAKAIAFDTVTTLFVENDKLWVGTGGAGVDVLAMPKRQVVAHYAFAKDSSSGVDTDLIQTVHRDPAGNVWVGTGSGLAHLDEKTGKAKFYTFNDEAASPSNDINDLLDADDGKLWVGTNLNLYLFDPKSGTATPYMRDRGDPQSLPAEPVTTLHRDRENLVWVGTMYNGVGCFHPLSPYFTFYNLDVRSYYEDPTGRIWIGTPSELCRTEKPHSLTGSLSCYDIGVLVREIYEDEAGIVWGGTITSGMFRLDPKTGALKFYEPAAEGANPNSGPNSNFVTKIHGTKGGLWLATFGGGLNYFDKATETFKVFAHDAADKASLSSDNVYTIAQAKHGDGLWIGTADGLNLFDPKAGRVSAVYRQGAKANETRNNIDEILTIHEADDGNVWVGSYGGGLRKIVPGTTSAQVFIDQEESGRNTVFSLIPDKQGFLWEATHGGVSKFDPKTGTFERYYPADGLQGLSYSLGSVFKDSTGIIYFGGIRGTNVFRPEQIKRKEYKAPIVLRRFQVDGKDVASGEDLSLAFNHKVLTLDFSVLSFMDPQASQYKYRIEGLHDWVDIGTRHFVTINTLPSGSYTIQVKGKSRTGSWNEEGIRLAVKVSPPPWRTWWAFVIYGVLLVGIIGLFILRQRTQLAALRRSHRLSELEREIALTSAIQEGCLPAERSVRDGAFMLEGFYRSAAECGGDWWSYEVRGNRYLVVVGDATGHGAGSAMVTAAAVACFRSLQMIADDNARMLAMNEEVLRVSRGLYHMTLTAVDLDIVTGEFVVLSAGGVPVFSMPPGERPRVLMCPGTPLGSSNFELGHLSGRLQPGERLMVLTDGIPEVALANSNLLGPRGVANLYMETRNQKLDEALQQLISKVEGLQVGGQDDDWTVVMMQWGNPVVYERAAPAVAPRRSM